MTGGTRTTDGEAPEMLTGWGRTAPTAARVSRPADLAETAALVRQAGRSVLARGFGRCYGDAAQSAGGDVLETGRLRSFELGPTGLLVTGAGAGLDEILRHVVPRGWFLPVVPGTRFVSIGGAVAADVHGKNHHVDGSLGPHVSWLDLVDGTGELHRLGPDRDPDAFWATVGGLGLTGVIIRVAVQLRPVTSSWIRVATVRAGGLDAVMEVLREHDRRFRYTVAWLDVLATGRSTGRGVITSGDHAEGLEVRDAGVVGNGGVDPKAYDPRVRLGAPRLPIGVVGRSGARAFNELWYHRAPGTVSERLDRLEGFFHPLDAIRGWNRLYGPRGFVQYQFVVPDGHEDVVRQAIAQVQSAGSPALLAVLKRFGAADPGPLSFPRPGWTLAIDLPVPADADRLAAALDRVDQRVAQVGGAVYLVKDARLRPELLPAMYPGLREWRRVRDRLDPGRRFGSDLSRRLRLIDDQTFTDDGEAAR